MCSKALAMCKNQCAFELCLCATFIVTVCSEQAISFKTQKTIHVFKKQAIFCIDTVSSYCKSDTSRQWTEILQCSL